MGRSSASHQGRASSSRLQFAAHGRAMNRAVRSMTRYCGRCQSAEHLPQKAQSGMSHSQAPHANHRGRKECEIPRGSCQHRVPNSHRCRTSGGAKGHAGMTQWASIQSATPVLQGNLRSGSVWSQQREAPSSASGRKQRDCLKGWENPPPHRTLACFESNRLNRMCGRGNHSEESRHCTPQWPPASRDGYRRWKDT